MRYQCLTLVGFVLAAHAVPAQPYSAPTAPPVAAPAAAPAIDPAHNRLDALLVRWEQEMNGIQTLDAHCTRLTDDKTFQVRQIFEGTARYMKPNLAMLEMRSKENPQVFEKYICTGTYLYEYVPSNKVIRIHELPPPRAGQVADDNFLSFLFGMRAEEAKRRYELKVLKEDQYYIYLEIMPRFPADQVDFKKARLVLNNKNFLPRQLAFEQPNGNQVIWDIPKIESGTRLNRNDFIAPNVPPGWNMVKVPRNTAVAPRTDVPPRVVRPQQ